MLRQPSYVWQLLLRSPKMPLEMFHYQIVKTHVGLVLSVWTNCEHGDASPLEFF